MQGLYALGGPKREEEARGGGDSKGGEGAKASEAKATVRGRPTSRGRPRAYAGAPRWGPAGAAAPEEDG